jgi:hypothetical protein
VKRLKIKAFRPKAAFCDTAFGLSFLLLEKNNLWNEKDRCVVSMVLKGVGCGTTIVRGDSCGISIVNVKISSIKSVFGIVHRLLFCVDSFRRKLT